MADPARRLRSNAEGPLSSTPLHRLRRLPSARAGDVRRAGRVLDGRGAAARRGGARRRAARAGAARSARSARRARRGERRRSTTSRSRRRPGVGLGFDSRDRSVRTAFTRARRRQLDDRRATVAAALAERSPRAAGCAGMFLTHRDDSPTPGATPPTSARPHDPRARPRRARRGDPSTATSRPRSPTYADSDAGPHRGRCVLHRGGYLFTGDHPRWDRDERRLTRIATCAGTTGARSYVRSKR